MMALLFSKVEYGWRPAVGSFNRGNCFCVGSSSPRVLGIRLLQWRLRLVSGIGISFDPTYVPPHLVGRVGINSLCSHFVRWMQSIDLHITAFVFRHPSLRTVAVLLKLREPQFRGRSTAALSGFRLDDVDCHVAWGRPCH